MTDFSGGNVPADRVFFLFPASSCTCTVQIPRIDGVFVAGLIFLLTGWTIADPILSVGIAGLISVGAWRILRETLDILLEATPKNIHMRELVADMKSVPGIEDVHDLHVWSIASGMCALSCHAMIRDLTASEGALILRNLETMLAEKYRIGHSTVQFECHGHQDCYCTVDGLYCQMEAGAGGHVDHHEHDHPGHDHSHLHVPVQPVDQKGRS